jgi:hypothetical protein
VFNSYSDAVSDYKSRNVNVDSLINMRSASSFHSIRNSIQFQEMESKNAL